MIMIIIKLNVTYMYLLTYSIVFIFCVVVNNK